MQCQCKPNAERRELALNILLRYSLTWRMQCQCKPNAERRELALNILLRYSLISQGKCGAKTRLNVKIITNTYLIYKRWHKTKKITSTRQPSTLKISTKHSQHLKTFYTLKSLTFTPLIFIFHLHLWNTIFCLLFGIFRQIKRKNSLKSNNLSVVQGFWFLIPR